MNSEFLRRAQLFSALPQDRLDWLQEHGEVLETAPGDILMVEGSPADALYVVLEGQFEILKRNRGQDVTIAIRGEGEMLGEMALIENSARTATVRAAGKCRLFRIDRSVFEQLLTGNATTAFAILRTVMSRLRTTELMLRQNDKLISLGTLAAGLAHELNNPAAAAGRSAGQLRQTIAAWLAERGELDALHLSMELNEAVVCRLRDDLARDRRVALTPSALERSDREYEIEQWLDEHGAPNGWELAPGLVSFGWDRPGLEAWCDQFEPEQRAVVVRWLATGYLVHLLLDEVMHSTERISEIVKAVKDYSYLDQAPLKEIDVHEGLESTLTMLKHKLRQGVTVTREFGPDVPRIDAFASELNQVWTNLIDNAIDAMHGHGELRLRTRAESNRVVVEIVDSGPGVPAEVLPRIFEPFFTTKEPGKGTGLGLHVSYNIIQKHRGRIEVQSQPGETRFIVSLPMKIR